MSKLLNICKTYSGIREDINEAEEMVINDMIQSEFKMISSEDIGKAFKMNASGKYWETIEAYQTFSPIYVGKVLTAYREWKRKENAKPKLIEPAKQLPEAKSDPKRSFDFICKVWKEEGRLPVIANWKTAFEYAEKDGLIKMSKEEKREAFKKKQAEVKRKINDARGKMEDYRKLEFDLQPLNVKSECRKDAIINYLKDEYYVDNKMQ